jgi:hypothetical protein
MCPHTAVYVSSCCYMCVLIRLYMCPHTVSSASQARAYMCPHTAVYVSSCCYICVLMLLYVSSYSELRISGEGLYVSSYCEAPPVGVSAYAYMCVLIQ